MTFRWRRSGHRNEQFEDDFREAEQYEFDDARQFMARPRDARSAFAERGLSHEERMRADDSRERFARRSGYLAENYPGQGYPHQRDASVRGHHAAHRPQGSGEQTTGQPSFARAERHAEPGWPKGYARSDQRIREDICDRLGAGEADPSEVVVHVANGVVTLEGFVSSRYDKLEIEEVAESVAGVRQIENRLRARRYERASDEPQHADKPS